MFCFDVKQRLRVFCRGNVARLDLFIILLQQTVRRDQSKRKDQLAWSIFDVILRKHAPFQIQTLLFLSQKPTNVEFVRLLRERLIVEKGKLSDHEYALMTEARLTRCS